MKERPRFFRKPKQENVVSSRFARTITPEYSSKRNALRSLGAFSSHVIRTIIAIVTWLVRGLGFLITHKLTKASLRASWIVFKHTFWHFLSFALLLTLYLLTTQVILRLPKVKFIPQNLQTKIQQGWARFYIKAVSLLDKQKQASISRLDLIELSIRNMQAKRTRSLITIGGMAIGIGAIVFLVSVGYGLQQLVVSRVARLDEMRQTDVTPQPGGKVKITDKTLNDFKDIPQVVSTLPLIAVVGRVSYQSSISDTAVFGVTADYLKQSAVKPVEGKIFDSNELSMAVPKSVGEVAGASIDLSNTQETGQKIADVSFSVNPNQWIRVRADSSTKSAVLGYTRRVEGVGSGEEVWGSPYLDDSGQGQAGIDADGKYLGKWLRAKVMLWQQKTCETTSPDCVDGKFVVLKEDGIRAQKTGYMAVINLNVTDTTIKESRVLGVSTTATQASAGASPDFVEIASESAIVQPQPPKTVSLSALARRQAIVNRAMLKILGIKETEAIGKVFQTSFVATGELLADKLDRLESTPANYTIIGVTPDEKTPIFYVPFIDLRSLGILNYSQVKVVVKDQESLAKVRRQVEAMGYISHSVADTVSQINSLFATARTILALLGTVALAVAALGMFNTLTVSLLERTREVGLMKAMGMKSSEVQELFLTESMIMGFFGGILGVIFGFVAGKLLGVILSVFAVIKGVGIVDVSYVPFSLVLIIVFLSLLVGIATGIYPAKRATKISALNALRYE